MADEREPDDATDLTDEEVAAETGEALPDREAMSLIKVPGVPGYDPLALDPEVQPVDPVYGAG
jgi:hypothetical protein